MAKSSKLSKLAASRLAVTTTVTSSAAIHGAQIADALHAKLFPDGPVKSDLTHKFIAALGGLLDRAALEVQEADLAHAAELLDDEEPRQRRDDAHAQLVATLMTRQSLTMAIGDKAASIEAMVGVARRFPDTPLPIEIKEPPMWARKQAKGQAKGEVRRGV